jgi:ribosomal protein S18 acetylase RimI-like enzyme
MELSFATATDDDVAVVMRLRAAVAEDLTRRFGHGHWSAVATEKAVLRDIRTAHVLLARHGSRTVGTLRLSTRKPWAIDPKYFSPCSTVLYLTDMAVDPELQGRGIGRRCLTQARTIAAAWPADAIRLDAYDGDAGAGEFYRKCGFHERGRITYRRTPLVYYEMVIQ